MVGLFSIAGGIDHLVHATFQKIPGILVQQRGAPVPLFSTLPANWKAELEGISGVKAVNAEVMSRVNRIEQTDIINPPRFLTGVDLNSRKELEHGIFDEYIVSGRFLSASDQGTKRCVISKQISEQFKKNVGQTIRVNGQELEVIGLYHTGSLLIDLNIVLDIATVRRMSRFPSDSVSCFYCEGDGTIPPRELTKKIEQHFQGKNISAWQPSLSALSQWGVAPSGVGGILLQGLLQSFGSPGDAEEAEPSESASEKKSTEESPVEARSTDDWADRFDEFSGDLKLFLTLMTTIGVLIAVLSIVNTMLMSVTERTIEFGILRANGWSRQDIVRLITCESALMGVIGGVLGTAIGWLAVQFLNWEFPDRLHLFAGAGLLGFSLIFSTLLGVLGGVHPAWIAAKMSPMQAIRRG